MSDQNEIVYWAENEAESVVVIAKLAEAGIRATQVRESYGAMNSLSFGILGEIGISVAREDAAKAEAVILGWDEPMYEDGELEETDDEAESDDDSALTDGEES